MLTYLALLPDRRAEYTALRLLLEFQLINGCPQHMDCVFT